MTIHCTTPSHSKHFYLVLYYLHNSFICVFNVSKKNEGLKLRIRKDDFKSTCIYEAHLKTKMMLYSPTVNIKKRACGNVATETFMQRIMANFTNAKETTLTASM